MPKEVHTGRSTSSNTKTNVDGRTIIFDMRDYTVDCINKYCELAGVDRKTLKNVQTPFVPEGSLIAADDCVKGQLQGVACAILMKDLWLGR